MKRICTFREAVPFREVFRLKVLARRRRKSPPTATVVSKCALPEKRLPPWVGKLREAVMRGIARRSRISFRQEYRVRKDISCRQAYRLREAQQKRYSADAERYACLRKHDMFAFANTICGVMPAQIENHPLENSSSPLFLFILSVHSIPGVGCSSRIKVILPMISVISPRRSVAVSPNVSCSMSTARSARNRM